MIKDKIYYETFDGTVRTHVDNIFDPIFGAERLSDTAGFIYYVLYTEQPSETRTQLFSSEQNALSEYEVLKEIAHKNEEKED